jgi:hypothetical protein
MRAIIAILSITTIFGSDLCAQSQVAAEPIVGLRDNRPDDYALVGAKVVIAPGKSIDNATILIEDTTIIAVGDDVAVPPGFMQMDLHGRTVYPGLIDAYSEVDVPADHTKTEAVYWNSLIVPQVESRMVASKLVGPIDKLRAQGITVRVVAPKGGIVKGSSAVVLLNDESRGRTLLKPNVWQHAQLTVPKNRQGEALSLCCVNRCTTRSGTTKRGMLIVQPHLYPGPKLIYRFRHYPMQSSARPSYSTRKTNAWHYELTRLRKSSRLR